MIKKYISIVFAFFLLGCSTSHESQSTNSTINPADRYPWVPADENEIEKRHILQGELDEIEKKIESQYLKLEALDSDEIEIRGKIKIIIPEIASIDTTISSMIDEENYRIDNLDQQIKDIRQKNKASSITLGNLSKKIKPDPIFSSDKYISAFTHFKKGRYFKSANLFKRALASNPPYELTDNLLFGLGISHYRLGNISMVSNPLTRLISEYPKSEKWYMAHMVLALTHYKKREKSQALQIIENGMKKKPPYFIRKMFKNLTQLIQK